MKRNISINNDGYIEGEPEHSSLISRKIAYKNIYLKNKNKYFLPFKQYVIHHIDSDKLNNSIKNLYICTQEQHKKIHDKQISRMKRFDNASEIDIFLRSYVQDGQKTLNEEEKYIGWGNKIEQREQEIEKEREGYWKKRNKIEETKEINFSAFPTKKHPIISKKFIFHLIAYLTLSLILLFIYSLFKGYSFFLLFIAVFSNIIDLVILIFIPLIVYFFLFRKWVERRRKIILNKNP